MQGCIKVLGGRCAPKGSHIKTLVVQTIAIKGRHPIPLLGDKPATAMSLKH